MSHLASVWHYSVYGLHLASNRPISALLPSPAGIQPTVGVRFIDSAEIPPLTASHILYQTAVAASTDQPTFQVWKTETNPDAYLNIRYTTTTGIADFILNQLGSQITITYSPTLPFSDITTYFLGPVLGCLLRLRKRVCLHAGVVAVGDKAIAIIGTKGAGKSTTVAGLAYHQRLAILSDDIANISFDSGQHIVQTGYPRLRLWPQTVACFSELSAATLPKVLSISDKCYLPLDANPEALGWRFEAQARPLAAIYELHLDNMVEYPLITARAGGTAIHALASNVYPEYTISEALRKQDFAALGRLMASVPLRSVSRRDGLDALPELCQAIVDDATSLMANSH